MNPSKAYFRAQENNDSVNFVVGSADQGESNHSDIKFPARVNKHQKVTQEGRDEGMAGMAFIAFLWFIQGWSRKVLFICMANKRIL